MKEDMLRYFLPEDLLTYFEILEIHEEKIEGKKKGIITISLDEKNILPENYSEENYESKGFYPGVKIQDFPIRGNEVYLLIRRRRWRHKVEKTEIKNDYTFIAEGSKITKELSDFLKGFDRIQRRHY